MDDRSRSRFALAVTVLMLFAAMEAALGTTMLASAAMAAVQRSSDPAKSAGAQLFCMVTLGYLAQQIVESLAGGEPSAQTSTISLMEDEPEQPAGQRVWMMAKTDTSS